MLAKEITLPSGAKLSINVAPFADSKNLYQAVLNETKELKLDPKAEVDVNFFKGLFCAALASKQIEEALDQCMRRCLYKGLQITKETWEPVEAREDYLEACFEVAKENILPFTKSLSAKYSHILGMLKNGLA